MRAKTHQRAANGFQGVFQRESVRLRERHIRLRCLFLAICQHSADILGFPNKKNSKIADSIQEVSKYAEEIMKSRTSEGVVIKDMESTYYIGSKKNPKWIKWKKFVDLDVMVLDKKKTKSNLYSYTVGIGPLTGEETREHDSVEIDGKTVSVEEVGDVEKPSNWKTNGARMKDAVSDAVKRCAMALGVGLHLWSQINNTDEYFLDKQLAKNVKDNE